MSVKETQQLIAKRIFGSKFGFKNFKVSECAGVRQFEVEYSEVIVLPIFDGDREIFSGADEDELKRLFLATISVAETPVGSVKKYFIRQSKEVIM